MYFISMQNISSELKISEDVYSGFDISPYISTMSSDKILKLLSTLSSKIPCLQ